MSEVSVPFQSTSYGGKRLPMLHVTFVVKRPNGSDFQQDEDFWVDSGFTGDLKMPQSFGSRLKGMGIEGYEKIIEVADRLVKSNDYEGQITRIELGNNVILTEPIDCVISCMGKNNSAKLIGLNALQRWKICLDLPQEILSMS